jgi:hypothetical protein
MKRQFPEVAKAHLDQIVERILRLLAAGPHELATARSEFMDFDGAIGGQVLESNPEVDYSYNELADLYGEMFEKAASKDVPLRQVEIKFTKDPSRKWRSAAQWITVAEYTKFREAIFDVVEELRRALRAFAADVTTAWTEVSFDALLERPASVIVFFGEEGRTDVLPTRQLLDLVARISAIAVEQGLLFTGAQWDVTSDADDAPGEIESAIGVIGADVT